MLIERYPMYAALYFILPSGEFVLDDIWRKACAKINAMGPYEIGDYERSDICRMLSHFVSENSLSIRSENRYDKDKRLKGNELFYCKCIPCDIRK